MMSKIEFILRPWQLNDLEHLILYANNFKIAKNMTNGFPHPYTKESGIAFIDFATKDDPIHIFAIDVEGKAVGGIGIHPMSDIHCKNAELGYWLAEPFWGNGIVTRAVLQMIDFGFKTYDITRIFATPFGSNISSQRVLEKAGFQIEATLKDTLYKNGVFEDELIYAIRR